MNQKSLLWSMRYLFLAVLVLFLSVLVYYSLSLKSNRETAQHYSTAQTSYFLNSFVDQIDSFESLSKTISSRVMLRQYLRDFVAGKIPESNFKNSVDKIIGGLAKDVQGLTAIVLRDKDDKELFRSADWNKDTFNRNVIYKTPLQEVFMDFQEDNYLTIVFLRKVSYEGAEVGLIKFVFKKSIAGLIAGHFDFDLLDLKIKTNSEELTLNDPLRREKVHLHLFEHENFASDLKAKKYSFSVSSLLHSSEIERYKNQMKFFFVFFVLLVFVFFILARNWLTPLLELKQLTQNLLSQGGALHQQKKFRSPVVGQLAIELREMVASMAKLNNSLSSKNEDLFLTNQKIKEQKTLLQENSHRLKINNKIVLDAKNKLSELNSELCRSNQDLENYAHLASHDLKAPLRAISNLVTWVLEDDDVKLTPQAREDLGEAVKRSAFMYRLLEDLLVYSQIGKLAEKRKLVQIQPALQEIADSLPSDKAIRFIYDLQVKEVLVNSVPFLKVFQNLIENSRNHGGDKLSEIKISVKEQAGMLQVVYQDNGEGISHRHKEDAVKMFWSNCQKEDSQSTGIGLAYVKKTVEFFGDRFELGDADPHGFSLYFTWSVADEG